MPHKGKDVESHDMVFRAFNRCYFAVLYLFLEFFEKLKKIQWAISEYIHITRIPLQSVKK
jgi:hypothetical protein